MKSRMPGDVSILYVEDDVATREIVTNMLKANGFNCILAENGKEGLDLYRECTPEVVLSDITMPVMTGLEMVRAIRADYPDAQFILLTALGESQFILDAIDIGVTQYVVKPVRLTKLLAAISQCITNIRQKTETQRVRHLEAISVLAGGLAHDFNNQLQVVMGYVSLAKKGADPTSEVFAHLDKAESVSKEVRELGRLLRSLSRGKSGLRQKMPLTPTLIYSVKAALHGTAIKPTFELPPDIPQVTFDKTQMQQVISHLALNAVDAMPQGGKLKVTARACNISQDSGLLLPPGNYVHITFADTGKGIASENISKIFDPYFTTKDMDFHKGQGLGLCICHSIISRHGGLISANNSTDTGATFNIWLPVADEEVS